MDRLHTCYAPVRRSPPKYCYSALPLDLHVLGLSLAFILSQDQTLRCKINYKSVLCPKRSIVVYLISQDWLIHSLMESTRTVCHPPLFLIIYIRCHHCGCSQFLYYIFDWSISQRTFAFGNAVAPDAAGRHKGDACLRSPHAKSCDFCGDPWFQGASSPRKERKKIRTIRWFKF